MKFFILDFLKTNTKLQRSETIIFISVYSIGNAVVIIEIKDGFTISDFYLYEEKY